MTYFEHNACGEECVRINTLLDIVRKIKDTLSAYKK